MNDRSGAVPRRATAGRALGVCAAAAVAMLAVPNQAQAIPAPPTDAQLSAGEAFLSSGFAELGSRVNGTFGSNGAAPAGYHPNVDTRLGFRADRGQDGWGVGTDDGDFFMPGSPYEAWGIQAGDAGTTRWNTNGATAIAGAYSGPTATAGSASATWNSSAPVDGVTVQQVISLTAGSAALTADVTLTNTTGSTMTNLYYIRAVDPDNCQTAVGTTVCDSDGDGVADSGGNFQTRNTLVSEVSAGDPRSSVSASQADGSYLELRTDATGSLTALVSASACFNPNGLDDFYATPPTVAGCTLSTTKGDTTFADTHVYLVIKTDSLAAGASRTFQFGYLLTLNATKTAQTITFPQPAGTARSAGPVTMAATASSGLAVAYTSQTTSVCTVSGSSVTLVAAGTCTIAARVGGQSLALVAGLCAGVLAVGIGSVIAAYARAIRHDVTAALRAE